VPGTSRVRSGRVWTTAPRLVSLRRSQIRRLTPGLVPRGLVARGHGRCQARDVARREWAFPLCLAELEAVAEWVVDVAATGSRERGIGLRLAARCSQSLLEGTQILDHETWMRLAGGGERLLDADMQLLRPDPEPAAAARPQRIGLRQLLETEQLPVERACGPLAAGGRRNLHVVDADDRHGQKLSQAFVP
jgi:hypothetical protein